MKYKNCYIVAALLVITCIFSGCEEKRKALVTAHTAMGELLISTKGQAKTLHQQKVINDETYQSIRINWLRAQKSYLEASDILERILDTGTQDISAYTELITQVSTILSDIALWLEEEKDEPTDDHITGNPTPTPDYQTDFRGPTYSGYQRAGPGGVEKGSAGNEGKSSGDNLGKLKVVSTSESVHNARDAIQIYGITEKTVEVRLWISVGSIVYTIDGSEPVLTDGVPYVAISQCLNLDAAKAAAFKAQAGMSGTKLHVMILETL